MYARDAWSRIRGMATLSDPHQVHHLHGYSPAIDPIALYQIVGQSSNNVENLSLDDAPVRILETGSADCRHLVHALCRARR